MVNKCTVEFSRDDLEDNPHPRGPVIITTQETIAMVLAVSLWNTWWSHYDMVNKCTVEFSRDDLEDNPHPRGPVIITTQETIAMVLAVSL